MTEEYFRFVTERCKAAMEANERRRIERYKAAMEAMGHRRREFERKITRTIENHDPGDEGDPR